MFGTGLTQYPSFSMEYSWLFAQPASWQKTLFTSTWLNLDHMERSHASLCGSRCSIGCVSFHPWHTLSSSLCRLSQTLFRSWLWSLSSSWLSLTTFMSSKITWTKLSNIAPETLIPKKQLRLARPLTLGNTTPAQSEILLCPLICWVHSVTSTVSFTPKDLTQRPQWACSCLLHSSSLLCSWTCLSPLWERPSVKFKRPQ